MRLEIAVLLVLMLFGAMGTVHAYSVNAAFSLINSTSPINGQIYFNLSAYFPNPTNYTIFLNSSAVLFGTIPANSSHYIILKYNISDMSYGEYNSHVYLSAFNLALTSSQDLYIKPTSKFIFIGDTGTTEITKNYSLLQIIIKNIGNTPININWSLPSLKNISYNKVTFQENFNLLPEQNETIPINLTLKLGYQTNISFAFTGSYGNYTRTRVYHTLLTKPDINMSFYRYNLTQINATRQLWTSYLKNYNNIPVNLLFKFTLSTNGSTVYYEKSYMLPVNASKVEIPLPESTVESVQVSYTGNNQSKITQLLFTAPKPPFKLSISSIVDTLGYVIFTVFAIILLVLIHLRFKRKERKKNNGTNK